MNDDMRWQALVVTLRRAMADDFPEWTDANDHDPGVTLLQLFAWLTQGLAYRSGSMASPQTVVAARQLARAALDLADARSRCGDDSVRLERPNYFDGQLLGSEDLRAGQDYFRERLRRVHRFVHGAGVVSGLSVSVAGRGRSAQVVIEPGLAFDANGEEIFLPEPVSLPIGSGGKSLFAQVRYAERPCKPVPAASPDGDPAQYSRVVETFEALLAPVADPCAVTLARVQFVKGRWSIRKQRMQRS